MKKGCCGTMSHDYKRHGTTTLFAALDVLKGRVIAQCVAHHRHQEFIRFLNKINREARPAEISIRSSIITLPTSILRFALGLKGSAVPLPLHPDLGILAQRRRRNLRQAHPYSGLSAVGRDQ